MNEQPESQQPGAIKVPAKSKHQVKVIVAENADNLEKMTNEFLGTISDEKRLISIVFSTNGKTGELVHIINYALITPFTVEEWKEKQEKQKKFAQGFVPDNLMPNGEEVSNL